MNDLHRMGLAVLMTAMASMACGSSTGDDPGSSDDRAGSPSGAPATAGAGAGSETSYEASPDQPCVEPGAYSWKVEAVPSDGRAVTCAVANMTVGVYDKMQPDVTGGAKDLERKQCSGTHAPPDTCESRGTRCNWALVEHFVTGANEAESLPAQNVDKILRTTVSSKTQFEISGEDTFSNVDGSNVRKCTWRATAIKR